MALRTRAVALLTLLVALAVAANSFAGEFKRDVAADVRVSGLKGAQKKALDIIGIDVTKSMYLTKVIVRFRGNLEREIRRPKLRKAGALVRLTLQGSPDRTLVGSIGAGRRHRVVGAGPGGPGASIQKGREVHLWVAGLDSNKLANVEARSFQGATARKSAWGNPDSDATRLLRLPRADAVAFAPTRPGESLSADCERIKKMADDLERTTASQPGVRDVVNAARGFLAQEPCASLLAP
jgi:hypothetical protein